jgi:hypothetical protein
MIATKEVLYYEPNSCTSLVGEAARSVLSKDRGDAFAFYTLVRVPYPEDVTVVAGFQTLGTRHVGNYYYLTHVTPCLPHN